MVSALDAAGERTAAAGGVMLRVRALGAMAATLAVVGLGLAAWATVRGPGVVQVAASADAAQALELERAMVFAELHAIAEEAAAERRLLETGS